jgi:PAS domain S-box-containing protein
MTTLFESGSKEQSPAKPTVSLNAYREQRESQAVINHPPSPAPAPPAAPPSAPAVQAPSAGEQRLRAVIEAAPVGLIVINGAREVMAANRAALTVLGTAQLNGVRGHAITEFIAAEHHEAVSMFITQVGESDADSAPSSLQVELAAPDGARRWVETRAVSLRRDGAVAILCVLNEIGEPRQDVDTATNAEAQRAYAELSQQHEQLNADIAREREQHEQAIVEMRGQTALIENMQRQVAELDELRGQVAQLDELRAQVAQLDELREQVAQLGEVRGQLAQLENVRAQVAELEERCVALARERDEAKLAVETVTDTEKARYETLLEEQGRWRSTLERSWATLRQASDNVEKLMMESNVEGEAQQVDSYEPANDEVGW